MWLSGAPQRRVARGAFLGADAHMRCYGQLRAFLENRSYTSVTRSSQPIIVSDERDHTVKPMTLGNAAPEQATEPSI